MKQVLCKRDRLPFVQIANKVFEDKKLSFKAKGLFGYLYSKPQNYFFSVENIAKETKDGCRAIYSGLKELEKYGYLSRKRLGTGYWQYFITNTPTLLKRQSAETAVLNNTITETTIRNNTHCATHGKNMKNYNENDFSDSADKVLDLDSGEEIIPVKVKTKPQPKTNNPIYQLFALFEGLNPSWRSWQVMKPQREAAESLLIEPFGIEKVTEVLSHFRANRHKQYCPQVTSPYALLGKWEAYQTFKNQKKGLTYKNYNKKNEGFHFEN